ncbi:MAG: ATP-binding protein [Nitrospirota bacterium]
MKNRFRAMSLVQKFSVSVVFLIFIIMVIFNALIVTHQRKALKAEMDSNSLVLAKKLANDVVEPLMVMDPLRLDELVRTTGQTPACVYAAVIDGERRTVAHTNRKLLGEFIQSGNDRQVTLAVQRGEERIVDLPGAEDIREIIIPVKAGYDVIGTVIVGFSREAIRTTIESNLSGLKKYILLVSLGIMIAGIWGAYSLARFLATPMRKLKQQMELVQAGNLDVEIPSENILDCAAVLNCRTRECPAYGRKRCWTIPGTMCFGTVQGEMSEKICDCRKCIVYLGSCGDEVGELVEGFNEMIKKLKSSIRELEESNKEKTRLEKLSALGEMSMTVAHEIKNPLNAIRGSVSYLKQNFEGEVLREFLSVIDDETKRLNEIVTSILRYARPIPLNLQVADINRLVSETVDLVRQEATERNVEVALALDERIPAFRFDPQQLKQALLNVLVNALESTDAGDTVRVATETFDSRVRLVVKDTGAGISEEALSQIFKPFFTTKTRGSGLGLACVERIVKDHKGDIAVVSAPGKGTEVAITLPLGDRQGSDHGKQ